MLDRIIVIEDGKEKYRPFVSDGCFACGQYTKRISIKVLQGTGATQFLILKSSLPRGSNSGEFVIVQVISNDFIGVPLHWVHLVSDLVSRVCFPSVSVVRE